MGQIFNMQEIGRRISSLRKKHNMTQMELADNLGISFQAVSNWERGITMPDIGKLPELAEIFKVSIDEILDSHNAAEIVGDVLANNPERHLNPQELTEIAPLLKPEQVDELVTRTNGNFTQEQSEQVAANMYFGGDYELSDDELFIKCYESHKIPFFSMLKETVSEQVKLQIIERAYTDGQVPFFAILINTLSPEQRKQYRLRAFEDGKIPFFSMLN